MNGYKEDLNYREWLIHASVINANASIQRVLDEDSIYDPRFIAGSAVKDCRQIVERRFELPSCMS